MISSVWRSVGNCLCCGHASKDLLDEDHGALVAWNDRLIQHAWGLWLKDHLSCCNSDLLGARELFLIH